MEQILITKEEYLALLNESIKYQSLVNQGVDNWIGYNDAMDDAEEEIENLNISFDLVNDYEFRLIYQPTIV
jgi:hypothetical protein